MQATSTAVDSPRPDSSKVQGRESRTNVRAFRPADPATHCVSPQKLDFSPEKPPVTPSGSRFCPYLMQLKDFSGVFP